MNQVRIGYAFIRIATSYFVTDVRRARRVAGRHRIEGRVADLVVVLVLEEDDRDRFVRVRDRAG